MSASKKSIAKAALVLAAGCGSGDPEDGPPRSEPDDYPVKLAAPVHGLQIQTRGRSIPPGADEEWCEVAEIPGDASETYFIGRIELAMAPYSHHVIVSYAPGGSARLDEAPLGEPVPCSGAHLYGTDLATLAASAEAYTSQDLPERIGYVVHGRQRLVFDYHALNTSEGTVPAAHRLNLHRVEQIDKQARVFGFYNQYIAIPPRSQRSFSEQCSFDRDVLVWGLARHTHRRGTEFDVWWSGGEHDGEHVWTSTDWEQDITYGFDSPVVMAPGTGFRWQCAFDNPTDETLAFGPEATDEMCILFGQFAAAGDVDDVDPQSCYRFVPSE